MQDSTNKQYEEMTRAVDPDPHSFSLLDPDPEWKFFQIKTEKMQENIQLQVYSNF